jgi:hypothetical protein
VLMLEMMLVLMLVMMLALTLAMMLALRLVLMLVLMLELRQKKEDGDDLCCSAARSGDIDPQHFCYHSHG